MSPSLWNVDNVPCLCYLSSELFPYKTASTKLEPIFSKSKNSAPWDSRLKAHLHRRFQWAISLSGAIWTRRKSPPWRFHEMENFLSKSRRAAFNLDKANKICWQCQNFINSWQIEGEEKRQKKLKSRSGKNILLTLILLSKSRDICLK